MPADHASTPRSLVSRRSFTALSTAALAAPFASARAQAKPVTIGLLNDTSGFSADLSGLGAIASAELALEDFGPTVIGRPIAFLKADHGAKPDLGVGIARQWYDQGVNAIFDIGVTTVALGVQKLALDKNKIAVYTSTGTVDLTRAACSPNGIHWTYDSYSVSVGAANANMKVRGTKKWFFMTVDYAYGTSLQAEASQYILANGGTVIGAARHAIETKDFSSDLLKAQSSGAEIIALATPTPLIANIIKQANEFGLDRSGQKLAPFGMMLNDVKALGPQLTQGLLVTEPFYWDQNDTTRAFAKRYFDKTKKMPNSLQASVYGAVTHYLKAVQSAGTDDTGPVLAAMKATKINDFMTKDGVIRADGRVLRDMHVFRVKTPAESNSEWDLYHQEATIPGSQAFSPQDASCKIA